MEPAPVKLKEDFVGQFLPIPAQYPYSFQVPLWYPCRQPRGFIDHLSAPAGIDQLCFFLYLCNPCPVNFQEYNVEVKIVQAKNLRDADPGLKKIKAII